MTMACFSGKGHGKNMSCYVMRVLQFLQCLFVELFLVQKNVLLHHLATMAVMLFSLFPSSRLQLDLWTSPRMMKTKWSFLTREEGQRRLVEVTTCMSVCLSVWLFCH